MTATRIQNRVRELRSAHGMSQAELAAAIGVTRHTVIAIEKNKYSPSLEVAFRIAEVFGVEITRVFSFAPE